MRSKQDAPETAPFGSAFSDPLVQVGGIYSRYSLSSSGLLLIVDELVRSPEENLRWQVPAHFGAEAALLSTLHSYFVFP